MFNLLPNQTHDVKCLFDSETLGEMSRFQNLTYVLGAARPRGLSKIWYIFLEVIGRLIPCIRQTWKNQKNYLIEREVSQLETDLSRSWVLKVNQVRCKESHEFIEAIREEEQHPMLMLSSQKFWAIIMNSLLERQEGGARYAALQNQFQSIEWDTSNENKTTLVAKCTFKLALFDDNGEFSQNDRETATFVIKHTLGEKEFTYSYEIEPWKKVMMDAGEEILGLGRLCSLEKIMMAMHEINVQRGEDFRQKVLEKYNQNQDPMRQLPTGWNEALINQEYDIDVKALYDALRQMM